MMRQEIRRPRWLFITCLLCCGASCCGAALFENKTGSNENNNPRVFSPRMDYDEWTPLGRGDPLKNDPTFDYVPPILDRVQYWMDSQTTEVSPKSDILVLGVTAKKTSPKIPEHYLKFVNGHKFMRNQESSAGYVNDFPGRRGAEPPEVIRKTNFRNGLKDYRNKDRIESIPASYYPSHYYNQNSKPETMMLPPPVVRNSDANRPHRTYDNPTKNHLYYDNRQYSTQTEAGPVLSLNHQTYDHPQNSYSIIDGPHPPRKHYTPASVDKPKLTTQGTSVSHVETINSYTPLSGVQHRPESTTASITSEKSNLIYQSSQTISGGWSAKPRQPALPSSSNDDGVTWESGTSSDNRENIYDDEVHQAAGSSHHEVVLGPNANIIVEGDSSDKEEIVMGQKEVVPPSGTTDEEKTSDGENGPTGLDNNSEKMYIVLANSSPSSESNKETAVTVVMPEKFMDENVSDTSGEYEQLTETTLTPLDIHLPGETERTQDEPIVSHSASHVSTHPQTMIRTNDVPAQPKAPTRIAMPHKHGPAPHLPHGLMFGDASLQRVVHHRPSHPRPVPMMTHYNAHPDTAMGMSYRETMPPPNRYSGMPMGHVQPNMRYQPMQPPKTMAMIESGNHVPPQRFRQHQYHQSLPSTTVTTNSLVNSMTGIPIGGIRDLLLREEAPLDSQGITQIVRTITTTSSTTPFNVEVPSTIATTKDRAELGIDTQISDDNFRMESTTSSITTSTTPMITTTAPTLTTDPIFSHYKQPANPMRGPMYLIIQGHSKVKTYKPWIDKRANQADRPDNIEITTTKHVSEFEKFVKENTKKIADAERMKEIERTTERPREQSSGRDSLMSFIDSGLGAFPVASSRGDLGDNNYNSLATVTGNRDLI